MSTILLTVAVVFLVGMLVGLFFDVGSLFLMVPIGLLSLISGSLARGIPVWEIIAAGITFCVAVELGYLCGAAINALDEKFRVSSSRRH